MSKQELWFATNMAGCPGYVGRFSSPLVLTYVNEKNMSNFVQIDVKKKYSLFSYRAGAGRSVRGMQRSVNISDVKNQPAKEIGVLIIDMICIEPYPFVQKPFVPPSVRPAVRSSRRPFVPPSVRPE